MEKVPSILHVMVEMLFLTSEKLRNYTLWYCQKVCELSPFYLTILYAWQKKLGIFVCTVK